ncbi:hypothetical protein D3C75_1376710 [compost metagenome]
MVIAGRRLGRQGLRARASGQARALAIDSLQRRHVGNPLQFALFQKQPAGVDHHEHEQ